MSVKIQVRRLCAGRYDIHTPSGTYELVRAWWSKDDPNCAGISSRPRWMLTYPGRYSADDLLDSKRDAVAYIRTIEEEKAVVTKTAVKAECTTHHVADERGTHTEDLPVPRCESGTTYGAWSEGAGGFVYAPLDCAIEVANWAADELRQLAKDDDTDTIKILAICPDHEEQPKDGCEECNAEADEEDENDTEDEGC
jgi:hypothetical protein